MRLTRVKYELQRAAALITSAVRCVGCRKHCHLLEPKPTASSSDARLPNAAALGAADSDRRSDSD